MKTVERTRTVVEKYNVYISKDGQEFTDEEKCKHHEMLLEGTRIVCPDCGGKGRWRTEYVPEYEHWEGKMGGYWKYKECERCHGKGYLEKKVRWE